MKKTILIFSSVLLIVIGILVFNRFTKSINPISYTLNQSNVTSFGGANGTITVSNAVGAKKFEYSNDNGVIWQESNIFEKLIAIPYQVKVRDKSNIRNVSVATLLIISQPAAKKTEVYVGIADGWNYKEQLDKPTEWSYVSQNADGLYINFIELDIVYKQTDLNDYANLFTNKNALIESDMNSSIQKEKGYISKLQKAGFTIPYTSLNYGWDITRQDNLKTYALKDGQEPRLCFVQQGPWVIGGSITSDNGGAEPLANANYRDWTNQADGMSTDGPMGLWYVDSNNMKAGSYSMVKYAHGLGKKALVMICPYGADAKTYNNKLFLETGISCVREHEDNDAEPDIWSVFHYATKFDVLPEQKDGAPYNSTIGMAYYLIKHIKGDPGTLDLYTSDDSGTITGQGIFDPTVTSTSQIVTLNSSVPAGTTYHYAINASNLSTWCDYASVLKATPTGTTAAWSLQFKLANTDVTNNVLSGGFKLYKDNRLNPLSTKIIDLYITRTESSGDTNFALNLELIPHNGSDTVDSLQIISQTK